MSAYGINKVCYLAQADLQFREQLRSDPSNLARFGSFGLTRDEYIERIEV